MRSSSTKSESSALQALVVLVHLSLNDSDLLFGGLSLKSAAAGYLLSFRLILIACMFAAMLTFFLYRFLTFKYKDLVASG